MTHISRTPQIGDILGVIYQYYSGKDKSIFAIEETMKINTELRKTQQLISRRRNLK